MLPPARRPPARAAGASSAGGRAAAAAARLNAQLEFLGEAAEIVVHPNDAAAAGVSDEQRLIVRSALGKLTGVARVDASVRRGAVSVPHGHAGANVNLLTSKDDIDLVTGMTRGSGVPVSLHPTWAALARATSSG